MRHNSISKKRQKLIDEKIKSSLIIGEQISVKEKKISEYRQNSEKPVTCTIVDIINDSIIVYEGTERDKSKNAKHIQINKDDVVSRNVWDIGANPFDDNFEDIRPIAYSFDSILFNLDILGNRSAEKPYKINGEIVSECNWNPFIYDEHGNKKYYQRPFVWTLKDNQLLIESIYQGIDCGKILVRKRGWRELEDMQVKGEIELSFNDIVDGKQRLNAVKLFINNQFKDLYGNYYSDLSYHGQHKFFNHQLFSYAEIPENTPDQAVIKQFLKLNFTGVKQSASHIKFVKSLLSYGK